MTATKMTGREFAKRVYSNEGHLPVREYGYGKLTTAWMLRDKQEARNEQRAPRHFRNPFAR